MDNIITQEQINTYCASMLADERSAGTVAKYRRDVTAFARWLGGRPVSKENSTGWKAHLLNRGYAPRTINSMLAAVNSFFRFAGWNIKVKFLKIQRQLFRDATRELNRAEYTQLLAAARSNGQERLALIMETLCATGIRISELCYITVAAAQQGKSTISLKGKIRTILLSTKLCRKLLKYAKKQKSLPVRFFSQAAVKAFRGGRSGTSSSAYARRRAWRAARCSRTISADSSPSPTTKPAATLHGWRMFWATAPSKPRASTSPSAGRIRRGSSTDWGSFRR